MIWPALHVDDDSNVSASLVCALPCSNVCYDTTGSLVMKIVDTCVSDRSLALHSVMSVWR
jgi:hypothetical protein